VLPFQGESGTGGEGIWPPPAKGGRRKGVKKGLVERMQTTVSQGRDGLVRLYITREGMTYGRERERRSLGPPLKRRRQGDAECEEKAGTGSGVPERKDYHFY